MYIFVTCPFFCRSLHSSFPSDTRNVVVLNSNVTRCVVPLTGGTRALLAVKVVSKTKRVEMSYSSATES